MQIYSGNTTVEGGTPAQMALHIGKLISKKIKEIGLSKSEFGRRIGVTPQNSGYILRKKSIDTELLLKISHALNYDFFQHYLGTQSGRSNESLINLSTSELKSQIAEIRKEIDTLELHNSYLREIVDMLGPLKQIDVKRQKTNRKSKNNG